MVDMEGRIIGCVPFQAVRARRPLYGAKLGTQRCPYRCAMVVELWCGEGV